MSHITGANEWRLDSMKGYLVQNFNAITNQEINVLNAQFIIAMNI